jgi:FlaA1/EpsC-like NDP-sugar epimerase
MSLRGRLKLTGKVLLDAAVLAGAFVLAFLTRFEFGLPVHMGKVLLTCLPCVVLLKLGSFALFGVTRLAWRYVSLVETTRILSAVTATSLLLALARLASEVLADTYGWAILFRIPLSVILIDLVLSFLGTIGTRVAARVWAERSEYRTRAAGARTRVPTLLVGIGRTGAEVAAQLAGRPDTGIHPLGFLDDDPSSVGHFIHGIPVLGPIAHLHQLLKRTGAEQVLITTSDLPGNQVRQVLQLCERHGITTKIIPEAGESGGIVNLSRVRSIAIEDLLRREPLRQGSDTSGAVIRGRRVLITGAGGSIGSELCRQVCRLGPCSLVLVEQAENNLFFIHRELAAAFPDLELIPSLADICDRARMEQLFRDYSPEVLLHAAAHKHVPLMEDNPGEAIKNNVLGTRSLADLANAHGVSEFVMISTDKAVNPSSVMGVSKRIAELYIQALSRLSPTRFLTVRFGNVLGSSGSVLPIFQEQIRRGGPVTVTHPEMKRYFMTIPEACLLVLEAAGLGQGGEIFILDMGDPVKIVDLARDLIRLSGLRPGNDIEIKFTGIRPGEKLFEELSLTEEGAECTRHPRIFIGKAQPVPWEQINELITRLGRVVVAGDPAEIHRLVKEIVPEYSCPGRPQAPAAVHLNGKVRAHPAHAEVRPPLSEISMPRSEISG